MTFPFLTNLRLDVEDPSLLPAGRILSQIRNPDGLLGGWGWITPVFGSTAGSGAAARLTYSNQATTGQQSSFYSEPAPVTPGTPYVAAWTAVSTADTGSGAWWYRAALSFLDAAGAVVGSPTQTAVLAGPTSGTTAVLTVGGGSLTVPAGAVVARLTFTLYGSSSGANPTTSLVMGLTNVRMGPVSDANNLAAYPAYTNVLNAATTIEVVREDLNVGTLNATIIGPGYDPSAAPLLRPGRRVRLVGIDADDETRVMFTGKVTGANVAYVAQNPVARRAVTTLSAVDAVADLANVSRPNGVALLTQLPDLLEGAGIPWQIGTSSATVPPAPVVSRNESASALDQVAITRDSSRGYAWVNVNGVLRAATAAQLSAASRPFNQTDYGNDLDVTFDLDRIVNVVTIKYLRINAATGETVEVPYGPYRDESSVREWGARSADFTIHGGVESAAAMQAFADGVLALTATPSLRVNRMTYEIRSPEDVGTYRGTQDLYDRDAVTNPITAAVQNSRITSIRHLITPTTWEVTHGYEAADGVPPAPQRVARLATKATVTPPPTAAQGQAVFPTFATATQSVAVVFDVPFATTPRVALTVRTTTPAAFSAPTISGTSPTGFTISLTRTSGTPGVNVDWLAFG